VAVAIKLLTELLCKLLDLPTLLDVVALGVVYRAPLVALMADGELTWALTTARATTPTSRCCCRGGSSGQHLILVAGPLLPPFTAALCSAICVGLASFPCL
jgi:hypothetical protein